eukprot:CAMPEP_0174849028 /NCGR_PEP_ID=MMETSP1114-20130205/13862_1 /TAXON_ID=312471 /ORGANISM="Neobodo designis, Strain CCAP 1951/1" /LENGTH=253 /DNA_ID=CAMNT_0016083337 /DNA_START=90 /DNA_END=848 /DNA_ORIENTATION=+
MEHLRPPPSPARANEAWSRRMLSTWFAALDTGAGAAKFDEAWRTGLGTGRTAHAATIAAAAIATAPDTLSPTEILSSLIDTLLSHPTPTPPPNFSPGRVNRRVLGVSPHGLASVSIETPSLAPTATPQTYSAVTPDAFQSPAFRMSPEQLPDGAAMDFPEAACPAFDAASVDGSHASAPSECDDGDGDERTQPRVTDFVDGADNTDSDADSNADGMPSDLNQYALLKRLGKGTQGEVFLALDSIQDELRAIKA